MMIIGGGGDGSIVVIAGNAGSMVKFCAGICLLRIAE